MTSFNAGSIEANLTLGRSQWVKDLRLTKKEIQQLENSSITIGIDADDTNARVVMDNLELMLEDLDNTTYAPSLDADAAQANATLEKLEAKLDKMDNRVVSIEADADIINAQIQLDILENHMDVLENDPVDIRADADVAAAIAQLDALEEKMDAIEADGVNIQADADTINAQIQLSLLEDQMDLLENDPVDIRVDVDSAVAEAKLIEIATFANAMDNSDIGIGVELDGYATVNAQMLTLEGQAAVLDGKSIDIDVDMDRDALESLVGSAAGGGGGGGGYLGLLRILLYAILILSPVLAVSISSLTAAIVAFTAALAGAAGAALILAGGLVGLVMRFNELDPSEYTPEMQAFADAIDAVSDAWSNFLDQIEGPGFELMAQALMIAADVLDDMAPLFNAVAEAMSGVLDSLAEWIDSPQYQEMLDFFGGFGVDMLVSFLTIGGNLLVFFGELFAAIEPFAREMMTGIEGLTASWAAWAAELDENRAFQDFMENASTYGPMVLDMLGSLLDAFMNIGEALRPFAGPMLEALIWFFDAIANIDPSMLTLLIGALAGLWLGLNVVAPLIGMVVGAIGAISTAVGIASTPLLLIAGLIVALAFAIKDLWENNETFRTAVIETWETIKSTVQPIIEDIVNAIHENWDPIVAWATELWDKFKGIVVDAMLIMQVIITEVLAEIKWLWDNHGQDIIDTVTWFLEIVGNIISGAFDIIAGLFKVISGVLTGDWDKAWEGIKQITSGALDILKGLINLATDPIAKAWGAITGKLEKMWKDYTDEIKAEWNAFRTWISEKWTAFKDWVSGWGVKAANLWANFTEKWADMRENISAKWEAFKSWVSGWGVKAVNLWDTVTEKWTDMRNAISERWENFKSWVTGWSVNASGIWDGIKNAFEAALNAIIGLWNNFELSVDIPDKIPGLPDSFTVSTPNVSPVALADGGYITRPTLALVGEAGENEVVAPEPILRRIVEDHSGVGDPGVIAEAIVQALFPLLQRLGFTIDELRQVIIEAGIGMRIEAHADANGNGTASSELAAAIAYQLRLSGFGGKAA